MAKTCTAVSVQRRRTARRHRAPRRQRARGTLHRGRDVAGGSDSALPIFLLTGASRSCRSRATIVDKNKGDTDLWLIPTKPGKARQLTSSGGSASSPVWSPDGEMIAFVGKRGDDKQQQLYVIAVNGGEARRVTNVPTGVIAPKWFPIRDALPFCRRCGRTSASLVRDGQAHDRAQ